MAMSQLHTTCINIFAYTATIIQVFSSDYPQIFMIRSNINISY